VTSEDKIQDYFCNYLLSSCLHDDNEEYTYGQYITAQMDQILEMLRECGSGTNQATFSIGGAESINQESPPCLRTIDCRILDGKLHFVVYFRSWDLWAGLPENLGGLQLLKEFMASECGVGDGEIIASSKGLHLYDYQWSLALTRLGSSFPVDGVVTAIEANLGEAWMSNGRK
jgi:thymidylate synthase